MQVQVQPDGHKRNLYLPFLHFKSPVEVTVEPKPTMTDPSQFLDCCENLLALRSFYIHSGEHCPDAIPLQGDGSFDVSVKRGPGV
jgi:hypothetical protein